MFELAGDVALVTGAGQNIGRAIALGLARAGARVAVGVGTNRNNAESVVEEIRQQGGEAIPIVADISVAANAKSIIAEVTEKLGPPLILVNNAAIRPRREFSQITYEEWDEVIRTNLSSVFYLSQAVLPGMLKAGIGRIINVSGGDAFVGSNRRVHVTTSKAGVVGFTRALAKELAYATKGQVTVNTVVPNLIGTDRQQASWDDPELAHELKQWVADSPLGRMGTPEEVAAVCLFLASKEASYLVGQAIQASGGRIMS